MRVILFGNSGSGKTTMARRLMEERSIPLLSLDQITWAEVAVRRPLHKSVELLRQFIDKHEEWIMEGCYGELVTAALPYCTELRFLNPGVDACVANCLRRPWEPDKYASTSEQDAMLERLIEWVREYETREDEFGLKAHRSIFDGFNGEKREYTSMESYESI